MNDYARAGLPCIATPDVSGYGEASPRVDLAMTGHQQAEEELTFPTAEEQRRDPSSMLTCHFAREYDVSRSLPRQERG